MTHIQKFLFERLESRSCTPKYRNAVLIVLHRLLINQTYHTELGAITYKPKNKNWIIEKQYNG